MATVAMGLKPVRACSTSASSGKGSALDNVGVARILGEIADLLEIKSENPFKIRAYQRAAQAIEQERDLAVGTERAEREVDLARLYLDRLERPQDAAHRKAVVGRREEDAVDLDDLARLDEVEERLVEVEHAVVIAGFNGGGEFVEAVFLDQLFHRARVDHDLQSRRHAAGSVVHRHG